MARIVFVIRSLIGGGAERQLLNLSTGLASRGHECIFVTWSPENDYKGDHDCEHFQHIHCDAPRKSFSLLALIRSVAENVAKQSPDIIHGYMDPGNFLALASLLWSPRARLVWGVRTSDARPSSYDLQGVVLALVNTLLSRLARTIICNSQSGARNLSKRGYPRSRIRVVPNGIDTERFCISREKRAAMRHAWGVEDDVCVIGMAARLDPMKGYSTFLEAAILLQRKRADIYYVCAGEGVEPHRQRILDLMKSSGLGDRLKWLGFCKDMQAFYNAIDINTLPSIFGEGFPNSIGESMACGTPCIVTNVGDAAAIVGNCGLVVNSSDPFSLALAWDTFLSSNHSGIADRCRKKIVDCYSLDALISNSEHALGLES